VDNVRRCNSDKCLLEASQKAKSFTIDLPVVSILHNPKKEWNYTGNSNVRIARDINIDWNRFSPDKYLFSHCSIVSSCNVEKNGYYIKAPTDELVNNNGNGWSNEVLLACFRSFVGAENYLEHVQIPELSKGKILDAVLRPVVYTSKTGKKADVYYTDILVATSRKHNDLIRKIESGELTTMSMGCFFAGTQVTLSNGTIKNIEDVIKDEIVISHTGRERKVLRPIKTHWFGDVYKITIDGRPDPIIVTGNHKFWSFLRREKCVCGCEQSLPEVSYAKKRSLTAAFIAGHKLRMLNPSLEYTTEERESKILVIEEAKKPQLGWKEARTLEAGDYLSMPSFYIAKETQVNLNRARLIGLFAAEGNFLRLGSEEYQAIEFNYNLETERHTLAEETKSLLEKEFNISCSIYERPEHSLCVVRTESNKNIVDWFYKYCGSKSWEKKLADEVVSWNDELLRAVAGGWVDGDGCLETEKNKRLNIGTVSKDLVNQMSVIFTRLRIYHRIDFVQKHTTMDKNGKEVHHRDAWYIAVPASTLNSIIGFTQRFSQSPVNVQSEHHQQLNDNYIMARVKSIEMVRPIADDNELLDVYCLEVEEDHSFLVANGIAVQNCQANWTQCSKCGKELTDNGINCHHLDNELMTYFVDEEGINRIVAELCGKTTIGPDGKRKGDPKSCIFIEASWVERPAFQGAVLNHYISEVDTKKYANILNMSTISLEGLFDDISRLRVADKNGMLVLHVACAELRRRKEEQLIDRVTIWAAKH